MQIDPAALEIAQTHSYTLGAPRSFTLSADNRYLYFVRSASGTAMTHSLWRLDIASGTEMLLFDPAKQADTAELTPEEEKQRERLRETSAGVTSYQLSKDGTKLSFALQGRLWLIDTISDKARVFQHVEAAFDPRFSPDGSHISYVTHEGLWVVPADPAVKPKVFAKNQSETVFWGRAEFIAAEEFERYRGHWWSPDGKSLAACRVDESNVQKAYSVSGNPWQEPESYPYPAAGTPNAEVSLNTFDAETGARRQIIWDSQKFPYLINVQWRESGLYLTVESRGQKNLRVLKAGEDGACQEIHAEDNPVWIDILQPLPYVSDGGQLVTTAGTDKRRLAFDGVVVTPPEHHVEDFIGLSGDWLIYAAAIDPKERIVFAAHTNGDKVVRLSPDGGLFSGMTSDTAVFVSGAVMGQTDRQHLLFDTADSSPSKLIIASNAAAPKAWPKPEFFTVGPDKLQACLILPKNHKPGKKLPVLLQVYGGPHHQEVICSSRSYIESQWWADHGFAVLAADGPGTPGRSLEWEKQIHGDFITKPALAQITVLKETCKRYPFLDASRVAVRGWSFGGYLSAFLSILYPKQIHASISGAPVTDWRLYDTHYTERYLGDPAANSAAYDISSLVATAASKAARPIMLIHGLQDDNVLFANSLRLLEALTEARCPYQFVPLVGASHFTKQAEQRAWLLAQELAFLRHKLSI